jgi:hypothetical protein
MPFIPRFKSLGFSGIAYKKDKLWEKVKKDFPKDPALQQVHYARLRIHEETKGMTSKEFVKYIKAKAKKVLTQGNKLK